MFGCINFHLIIISASILRDDEQKYSTTFSPVFYNNKIIFSLISTQNVSINTIRTPGILCNMRKLGRDDRTKYWKKQYAFFDLWNQRCQWKESIGGHWCYGLHGILSPSLKLGGGGDFWKYPLSGRGKFFICLNWFKMTLTPPQS